MKDIPAKQKETVESLKSHKKDDNEKFLYLSRQIETVRTDLNNLKIFFVVKNKEFAELLSMRHKLENDIKQLQDFQDGLKNSLENMSGTAAQKKSFWDYFF